MHTAARPPCPRPPAMSTCSQLNVRILPQAYIAHGPAGTNQKCADLPSAAHTIHNGSKPALPPMTAPPTSGSVSCHKKRAAVTDLRTSCTQNDIFCAFVRQKRPRNADIRILLRESMPLSCHEKQEKFFKVGPIWPKHAFRYPIDTLSIPDFPRIRSKFTSHLDVLGPILDRIGRILAQMRGATNKETDATTDFEPAFGTRRRNGPRRGPPLAQKTGRLHPRYRRIRCQTHPFSNG